ncbi:group II intron reverse transcriptase/maturase [Kosakonia cowanii]|nr:group II intron reverse transcriptase/maturase [Kosakonia cowanii]
MIAKAQHTAFEKVRVLQRKLYLAAKTEPKRKFGVLYDKVCSNRILGMAYAQVKANNGASGVDQVTFDVIENEIGVGNFLRDVQSRLRAKRYKPQPVRRVFIPKAIGGMRPLGIPVIEDRVVQAAVKIVIEPLFEASFKDFSYGFRPRRNAQQALREIYKWLNFKCHWVIDADLKGYFDTIPHDKLMLSVKTRVTDRSVLKLIEMWLKSDVMGDSSRTEDNTGTPQGGVISPLLANIYLHWLDHYWDKQGFGQRQHDAHLVRYADDFVILCRRNPGFYMQQARKLLNHLGLTLNEEKTKVVRATNNPFEFLGHTFTVKPSKRTGKLKTYYYPSTKSMKSVKKKLKGVISHSQHWNLTELIKLKINPVLRGWGNYFRASNSRLHFRSIANYTVYTLCIMLRKKHKKRSKGWRDHPPSWFYDYHGLFKLYSLSNTGDESSRYGRPVPL